MTAMSPCSRCSRLTPLLTWPARNPICPACNAPAARIALAIPAALLRKIEQERAAAPVPVDVPAREAA